MGGPTLLRPCRLPRFQPSCGGDPLPTLAEHLAELHGTINRRLLRCAGPADFNYKAIVVGPNASFSDSAIIDTLIFVGVGIALETVLGVLLAVILARPMRRHQIFPGAVPYTADGFYVVAATITWGALFNTSQGWVNYFTHVVGLGTPNWLGDPHTAMGTLILVDSWTGVPLIAVIVMAGILLLPQDPIEAAKVDGASPVEVFRFVVLPGVRPVLTFAVMFRLVTMFGQFAEIQLLTNGGRGGRRQS